MAASRPSPEGRRQGQYEVYIIACLIFIALWSSVVYAAALLLRRSPTMSQQDQQDASWAKADIEAGNRAHARRIARYWLTALAMGCLTILGIGVLILLSNVIH